MGVPPGHSALDFDRRVNHRWPPACLHHQPRITATATAAMDTTAGAANNEVLLVFVVSSVAVEPPGRSGGAASALSFSPRLWSITVSVVPQGWHVDKNFLVNIIASMRWGSLAAGKEGLLLLLRLLLLLLLPLCGSMRQRKPAPQSHPASSSIFNTRFASPRGMVAS